MVRFRGVISAGRELILCGAQPSRRQLFLIISLLTQPPADEEMLLASLALVREEDEEMKEENMIDLCVWENMENVVAGKSSDQLQRLSSENLKHWLHQPTESPPQRLLKIAKVSGDDDDDDDDEEVEEERESERTMSQNPRIQRYLVAIEYIGTRFVGAQQQATGRTVVGVLEEAFRKFIGQPVSIFCSSRTDAGVHALSNVCHVDVERISKRKPGEVVGRSVGEGAVGRRRQPVDETEKPQDA